MTATAPDQGTATRILDIAEELVQVRGFNAFSYAHVASALKLTKASLHYHFPSKAELGLALVTRYSDRFAQGLDRIDGSGDHPPAKLSAYVDLYADVLAGGRMCLCGMLAADYPTLPKPMQAGVRSFIDRNQSWLAAVLDQGAAEGSLHVSGSSVDAAMMLLAGLEGAMLVARPYGDVERFKSAAKQLLAAVGVRASAL
jgi:TetR/AcrR family transcriptional regulator, transcriptional repressor for nem operon